MDDHQIEAKILFATLTQQAAVDSAIDFCHVVAKQLKMDKIEGSPVDEWFAKRQIERLEKMIISIEDKNPEVAARFQQMIDEFRKK